MKNNDEFNSLTDKNDDAQAVKESELLPIYDSMHFSGDIQPLEDIRQSEYVIADYSSSSGSDAAASDRQGGVKRKKIPVFSGLNKKVTALLVALACIVALGTVGGGVYAAVQSGKNNSPVKVVYTKDAKVYLMLENGDSYPLTDSQRAEVSGNGMRVCYSRNTSSSVGKYDLRLVDASKRSSLKKAGTFIDEGVDENWKVNADGSFITYSKTIKSVTKHYIYSAQAGKSLQIASDDVDEVFLPPEGDVIYFTRRNGSIYSLHRMRYGEDSKSVASEISAAKFYASDKAVEVMYTVETGNQTNVDVYRVTGLGAPSKVCSDVSEVYLNEYTCGGNLYYFTKNNSKINWQDFIVDGYFESDAAMKKPVQSDYLVEKGFIFKRQVLDTAAYNAALNKYRAKEKRDGIREELDALNLGLTVKDEYTCYVYCNSGTGKLASGIVLDNVVCCSEKGSPAMVFRKSVIDVENKLSMDVLLQIADRGSVKDAADYVTQKVGESYKVSDDYLYAYFDGNKALEYSVDGIDVEKTEFIFNSGKSLYTLTDGRLCCNSVQDKKLVCSNEIDSGVSNAELNGKYIYYTKQSQKEQEVSLFRAKTGEPAQKLADGVYYYHVADDDYVTVLLSQQDEEALMSVNVFRNNKLEKIDGSVRLNGFACNGKSVAYIKNSESLENTGGDLYVYFDGAETKLSDDDVDDILFVRD